MIIFFRNTFEKTQLADLVKYKNSKKWNINFVFYSILLCMYLKISIIQIINL